MEVRVSQDEMKQLRDSQEHHEIEELRATVRLLSLSDAQERFEQVGLNCETCLHVAEEAYVNLVEDDLDNFETAKEKSDKLERIEREHDHWIEVWNNQRRRLNWESRQAQGTL
jgi:hypothetical protein